MKNEPALVQFEPPHVHDCTNIGRYGALLYLAVYIGLSVKMTEIPMDIHVQINSPLPVWYTG